jgi:hypothetical protein
MDAMGESSFRIEALGPAGSRLAQRLWDSERYTRTVPLTRPQGELDRRLDALWTTWNEARLGVPWDEVVRQTGRG